MRELYSLTGNIAEKIKTWYAPSPAILKQIELTESQLIAALRQLATLLKIALLPPAQVLLTITILTKRFQPTSSSKSHSVILPKSPIDKKQSSTANTNSSSMPIPTIARTTGSIQLKTSLAASPDIQTFKSIIFKC